MASDYQWIAPWAAIAVGLGLNALGGYVAANRREVTITSRLDSLEKIVTLKLDHLERMVEDHTRNDDRRFGQQEEELKRHRDSIHGTRNELGNRLAHLEQSEAVWKEERRRQGGGG